MPVYNVEYGTDWAAVLPEIGKTIAAVIAAKQQGPGVAARKALEIGITNPELLQPANEATLKTLLGPEFDQAGVEAARKQFFQPDKVETQMPEGLMGPGQPRYSKLAPFFDALVRGKTATAEMPVTQTKGIESEVARNYAQANNITDEISFRKTQQDYQERVLTYEKERDKMQNEVEKGRLDLMKWKTIEDNATAIKIEQLRLTAVQSQMKFGGKSPAELQTERLQAIAGIQRDQDTFNKNYLESMKAADSDQKPAITRAYLATTLSRIGQTWQFDQGASSGMMLTLAATLGLDPDITQQYLKDLSAITTEPQLQAWIAGKLEQMGQPGSTTRAAASFVNVILKGVKGIRLIPGTPTIEELVTPSATAKK